MHNTLVKKKKKNSIKVIIFYFFKNKYIISWILQINLKNIYYIWYYSNIFFKKTFDIFRTIVDKKYKIT